jgi:hypothetical protein
MSRAARIAAAFEQDADLARSVEQLADVVDELADEIEPLPAADVLNVLADGPALTLEEITVSMASASDRSVSEALNFLRDAQFVESDSSAGTVKLTEAGQKAVQMQRDQL